MKASLTRYGNEWAFVVDQSLVEQLRADEGTSFEIVTDGRTLILKPETDAARAAAFEKALNNTNEKFAYDLKKLAE